VGKPVIYTLQSVAGNVTIRVALFGAVTPERFVAEQAEANRRAYQLAPRAAHESVPTFLRPRSDWGD
jgi:hypothetical protein